MNKFTLQSLLAILFLLTSCAQKPVATSDTAPAKMSSNASSTARWPGDYPDPSVIRVDGTYWAVATTSMWAPAFTLFSSPDLTHWKIAGAVFENVPAWSDGNYWAPEIARMDDTYFVYYAAKNRKTQSLCVAVATAKAPTGPYKDHGPLVCETVGSIDAAPVVDENGDKYLFWKEDGNSQKKPTPIHLQKLSKDGTKLVGTRMDTITNDAPWEKQLVEAPYVMKKNGMWYMFYAGNDCCGRQCNYAVGVARAKTLTGHWEKNPANPILASNDVWKCPGHGSVVSDPDGRDFFLYHAYAAKDFNDVGRQVLADSIDWSSASGWPTINNGLGAGLNVNGLLKPVVTEPEVVQDDFSSKTLHPGWQWPADGRPTIALDSKNQELRLSGKGSSPVAAILGKTVSRGNYSASTKVDLAGSAKQAIVGIAAVGNPQNAMGIAHREGKLIVWQIKDKQQSEISNFPVSELKDSKEKSKLSQLHLKMTARDGHFFQFSASVDGTSWTPVGPELDGAYLPPWDLGIRVALTAGNGAGVFKTFTLQ